MEGKGETSSIIQIMHNYDLYITCMCIHFDSCKDDITVCPVMCACGMSDWLHCERLEQYGEVHFSLTVILYMYVWIRDNNTLYIHPHRMIKLYVHVLPKTAGVVITIGPCITKGLKNLEQNVRYTCTCTCTCIFAY